MPDGDQNTGKRHRRVTPWQRRRRKSLLVLLVLAMLGSTWLVWRLGKRVALNDALRGVAELGVMTTIPEYEARFGPYTNYWQETTIASDSPYHAALAAYVQPSYETFQAIPGFKSNLEEEDLRAVPYLEETLSALQEHAEANTHAVGLLHECLQGDAQPPESNAQVELLVTMLCVTACVEAHNGNGGEAIALLEDALILIRGGMGRIRAENPVIARDQHVERVFVALKSIARRVPLTAAQLEMLKGHLTTEGWLEQRRNRTLEIWSSHLIAYGGAYGHPITNMLTGNIDQYRAWELRSWAIHFDMLGKSLLEQRAIIDSFEGDAVQDFLHVNGPHVTLELLQAGLDIMIFHAETGSLPESLQALTPETWENVPVDFWSGEPFRYEVSDGEFVVYSVWRNRQDDGGNPRSDRIFKTTPVAAPAG